MNGGGVKQGWLSFLFVKKAARATILDVLQVLRAQKIKPSRTNRPFTTRGGHSAKDDAGADVWGWPPPPIAGPCSNPWIVPNQSWLPACLCWRFCHPRFPPPLHFRFFSNDRDGGGGVDDKGRGRDLPTPPTPLPCLHFYWLPLPPCACPPAIAPLSPQPSPFPRWGGQLESMTTTL
jgi:hypothetical protein